MRKLPIIGMGCLGFKTMRLDNCMQAKLETMPTKEWAVIQMADYEAAVNFGREESRSKRQCGRCKGIGLRLAGTLQITRRHKVKMASRWPHKHYLAMQRTLCQYFLDNIKRPLSMLLKDEKKK